MCKEKWNPNILKCTIHAVRIALKVGCPWMISLLHDVDYIKNVKEITKGCNEIYNHMNGKELA